MKLCGGSSLNNPIDLEQYLVSCDRAGYLQLVVTSSRRPWFAVFLLTEKINVFQHGGD